MFHRVKRGDNDSIGDKHTPKNITYLQSIVEGPEPGCGSESMPESIPEGRVALRQNPRCKNGDTRRPVYPGA
jgi:hypothetical protein